jgi:hypothetical protein
MVQVLVLVDADGRVSSVEPLTGPEVLRKAAVAAVTYGRKNRRIDRRSSRELYSSFRVVSHLLLIFLSHQNTLNLAKLEKGNDTTPPIEPDKLNGFLGSHHIAPALLRADKFDAFMEDRQNRLLALIEDVMGKTAYTGAVAEEGVDIEADPDTVQAELTIASA